MTLLRSSWHRCWNGLGAASGEGDGLMKRLMSAYEERHRHYHTRQHLTECIERLGPNLDLADEPAEVEMALWFHDAIYNVRASDNESRSADWARTELLKAGVAPTKVNRICLLIMATRHTAAPEGKDQALLVDIDLAILAAPRQRFDEYEQQVRLEYSWVPGFLFRRKRRALLEDLLSRPAIYHTARLGSALEHAARANLTRSLLKLSA